MNDWKTNMDRSPSGASPSSMTMSTFLGGSSPSPGGGSSGNLYQNYSTTNNSAAGGQYSVSMSIRHEIQRFESVHPSIYAIYDLIELIPDQLLSQQIREHVVCIEGRSLKFLCTHTYTHTLGIFDEKKITRSGSSSSFKKSEWFENLKSAMFIGYFSWKRNTVLLVPKKVKIRNMKIYKWNNN